MIVKWRTIKNISLWLLALVLIAIALPGEVEAENPGEQTPYVEILGGFWKDSEESIYHLEGIKSSNVTTMVFFAEDVKGNSTTPLSIISSSETCNNNNEPCSWGSTLDLSVLAPGDYYLKVKVLDGSMNHPFDYLEKPDISSSKPPCSGGGVCIVGRD